MTEIRTSEQIGEIAAALAKAQGDVENVAKDKENPHYKSRYATLAGALDEVRPKFAKHGLAILQMPVNGEGANIGVVSRLTHSSGQWIESALYVAPTKFDAQGAGSAITYLRRYSLMAIAGIAPDDDDGEAAIGRPQSRAQAKGTTDAPPDRVAAVTRATEIRDRLRKAIDGAKEPRIIDEIISVNEADLAFVKKVHADTSEKLLAFAGTRKSELLGATG